MVYNDFHAYDPAAASWSELTPNGGTPPFRSIMGIAANADAIYAFGGNTREIASRTLIDRCSRVRCQRAHLEPCRVWCCVLAGHTRCGAVCPRTVVVHELTYLCRVQLEVASTRSKR